MTLEVATVNTYISILLWASCSHIIFPNTERLGYLTCIRLFKYYQPTFTCIQTAAPGDTSPLRTSLQTVFLSGRCCGRSWWSSGPEAGPYPGTARAGPRKRERFRLTSGTGRSHRWTYDLQGKKKKVTRLKSSAQLRVNTKWTLENINMTGCIIRVVGT